MARFLTFYSYKGGVGRSLALANVAWLLANHELEPARVLAVDFDLAAPGLVQVFGLKRPKSWPGIVDYVTRYLDDAQVPPISDFIHKTSHHGIDILPAGRMDKSYQRKLERLDWRSIYSSAYGYELIERMKADIDALRPEYDYVLVDSLTGYSDIGGICVKQIPDAVVLLFRLNSQNLDGIGSVYNALRGGSSEKGKPVVPVITPSWPFLDAAAEKWTNKAQALFPDSKLLEISFDSGMSFGEPIISRVASKLPLTSKVLADYRYLTETLRAQNPADPLTIWDKLRSERQLGTAAERVDMLVGLLKRRPHSLAYWEFVPQIMFEAQYRPSRVASPDGILSKLMQYIDSECAKKNKFAFYGRAMLRSVPGLDNSDELALDDLDHALRIDPEFAEAKMKRGYHLFSGKRYSDAIADFLDAIPLLPRQRRRLEVLVATCYLRLFDVDAALRYLAEVMNDQNAEPDLILIRAKALYLMGNYEDALRDVRAYLRTGGRNEVAMLLPAQILAAMGRRQEAAKELQEVARRKSEPVSKGNLAEAFLSVDPAKTIEMVGKGTVDLRPPVRWLLQSLANIFLGVGLDSIQRDLDTNPGIVRDDSWDKYEVTALLRARERDGSIAPDAALLAHRVLQAVSSV